MGAHGTAESTARLEHQIANLIAAGHAQREVAALLGIAQSSVSGALKRIRQDPTRGLTAPPEPEDYVEIPLFVRDYSAHEVWRVYPMGDFHIGSPAHDRRLLDEWLDYLFKRGEASLLNTGDNINAAILGSKSDIYSEKLSVDDALFDLEDRLRPLAEAGLIDALGEGNHENRIYRATGVDPIRHIARNLKTDHWNGSCVIRYLVGNQTYNVYLRHGTGNAPASMQALVKSGQVVEGCDVYVTGHTHRQGTILEDVFVPGERRIHRRERYYVSSGSFVKYERYAAERGYNPSHLGAPRIRLSGDKHDVHVSV